MVKPIKNEFGQPVCIIAYSALHKGTESLEKFPDNCEVHFLEGKIEQGRFSDILSRTRANLIMLMDLDRISSSASRTLIQAYSKDCLHQEVGYCGEVKPQAWKGIIYRNYKKVERSVLTSPVLIAPKKWMERAYAGGELGNPLTAVGYSLQQVGGVNFKALSCSSAEKPFEVEPSGNFLRFRYTFKLPIQYFITGTFFKCLFQSKGKVQRDMVYRLLFLFFACFTFLYMPWASQDYGVTGDEFVDHRHAGYVLDYFTKGDTTALYQPKTVLHLYGNSVQVVAAAICRWFDIDNYYETRHVIGGLVGATGILIAGLAGLRWGGGLCGLLTLLLMFFTPRFFGHSMNNLKDIPFAVGYVVSLYYIIRLFDHYPYFRVRHLCGAILGIALALGTRSGGLILYPMLFMYAGLFYIQYFGIKEFYKFKKHLKSVEGIFGMMLLVLIFSYALAICLWPFALQKPFTNVLYSLERFTHYSIGLRTIFDGEQMMSNMLPWQYAPKYLCIGMPLVTVIGFAGYILYLFIRRKEFSLVAYFFLFAAIFPVFWVVYKNSNLYGGIRHLLFVMPPMVIVAGRFWEQMMDLSRKYLKAGWAVLFLVLFSLPVVHAIKNHPNEYVYFNEWVGGMKGAYGNYETDYYFNSLKQSADWFKKNIMPALPQDRKTVIVTQGPLDYYFRKDTNIQVLYTRFYEKYAKDWDYAILGNVYVNRFQLQHGLFPPEGSLFAPTVDGYPVSCVVERQTKAELEGFQLEKKKQYRDALAVFENYTAAHKNNEEVWGKMAKLYYTIGDMQKGKEAVEQALSLHPTLNEALYVSVLIYLNLRDYPGAFEAVNKILSENSSSVDAYYLRSTVYMAIKNYPEAIKDLNKILSIRPKYDRALVLAGDIFKETGNYSQAINMYQKALKLKNTVNTQVAMADAWCRAEKYDQAEEILQTMVQAHPTYFPIFKVWARIYLMKGELRRAGEYLLQLQQVNRDAELFVLRAMYLHAIQHDEDALVMLENALIIDPKHPEALNLKQVIKGKNNG